MSLSALASHRQTLSSQRLPASQHLFPLLYLNNQVSELGRAFLPRGKSTVPCRAHRAEDDAEALGPVTRSSSASAA